MSIKSKKLDIGRRIAARRLQQGIPQAAVSRRTGIDPSYLSRIETGKVHPTVRTAMKIADALRLSLEDLVGPTPPEKKRQPCPVSGSGRCILDLIETGAVVRRSGGAELYSTRQLKLLRRFTTVLQKSDPSVVRALDVLISEMANGRGRSKR
jgi:transcriptional regulator with XRE-family HTH domain